MTVVGNQGTGKTRLLHELVPVLGQNREHPCRVFHGAAERDAAGQPVRYAALSSLLRDRFELLPIPENYYDDIEAKWGLAPAQLGRRHWARRFRP